MCPCRLDSSRLAWAETRRIGRSPSIRRFWVTHYPYAFLGIESLPDIFFHTVVRLMPSFFATCVLFPPSQASIAFQKNSRNEAEDYDTPALILNLLITPMTFVASFM